MSLAFETIFGNIPAQYKYTAAGLLAVISFRILLHRQRKAKKFITDYSTIASDVDAKDLSNHGDFDFVIVGGGTAGCVLASRLTENTALRVLVIEAGGSGRDVQESTIPSGWGYAIRSQHGYQFYTTPQDHANGKKKYMPRGKLLGGCSSVNAMMAQYGSPSDFDEWAKISGDKTLSWNNFNKYLRKLEKYTPDPQYPEVTQRGTGPVGIGYFNTIWKGCDLFVKSGINIGIPFTPDFNRPEGTLGINRMTTYIDKDRHRVSAETAYLTDEVLSRPNLKVAIHCRVTKILFEKVDSQLHAVGVQFSSGQGKQTFSVRARQEVILCGGAIHSPQLLMISGVGPEDHLRDNDIEVVHDLPGVGSHLVDHTEVNVRFKEKAGTTLNYLTPTGFYTRMKFVKALVQYQIFGTGPLSSNLGEAAAFLRSDDPAVFPLEDFPKMIEDSTSGPNCPDIEIIIAPIAIEDQTNIFEPSMHAFSIYATNLRPTSVGTIRLNSSNPWGDPLIDPNYCQTQHDVDVLVRGIQATLKIAHAEPLASIIDFNHAHPGLDNHLPSLSDEELAEIVRDRVETLYHPSCTCRMAPLREGGVVDSQHRVYGIANLRVCDVSTFPSLVSGHPTGACIASAERLAEIIRLSS